MKFIVGLGNPGQRFKSTKHNIGFNVVLELAKENDIKIKEKKHSSLIGRGWVSGEKVALVLPQTYMNLSGKAISELFRDEVESIDDLIVICDDINLDLGRIRLRKRGSSGGHKGLEAIIHNLGRDDFARLRVGIATEFHKGDITHYVLTPFRRKYRKNVSHAVSLAKDAASFLIKNGVDETMHKFNKKRTGIS